LGVSKIVSNQVAINGTRVGTPLYLAPELVKHQPYDNKVFIFIYKDNLNIFRLIYGLLDVFFII